MRFLPLNCSILLISICMVMQQHSVAAKPFIFKFFVPQAPARTDSSASSPPTSGIDLSSILSTKLNLLTSLLRTGLSSGGFNFGLKKRLPTTEVTSTRRPYTSTTIKTPEDEFELDSTTKSSLKSTTPIAAATTTIETIRNDKTSASDELSKPIENNNKDYKRTHVSTTKGTNNNVNIELKVTTENTAVMHSDETNSKAIKAENGYDYTTSKVDTARKQNNDNNYEASKEPFSSGDVNNGFDYTIPVVKAFKPSGYGYSTSQTGYNYNHSNQAVSDNEISNEIMAISNQYFPAF